MKKTLILFGGAIAGIFVLGVGAVIAADTWLDQKAKLELETQLTEATGVTAAVGKADVQLFQKKVAIDNLNLSNLAGFPSTNLLTINRIELANPSLQSQPIRVTTATIEGVQINLDGNLDSVPNPMLGGGMPKLNLLQLVEQLDQQNQNTLNSTATANATEGGNPDLVFTIDQLTISAINVNINLEVPWQETAIAHDIQIPEITLTEVNNLNLGEKLGNTLVASLAADLQAFFFTEVLPDALAYAQQSMPKEIDLSNIELPEGVELPDNIQLPNIKLP